jgi:hypothetical protein
MLMAGVPWTDIAIWGYMASLLTCSVKVRMCVSVPYSSYSQEKTATCDCDCPTEILHTALQIPRRWVLMVGIALGIPEFFLDLLPWVVNLQLCFRKPIHWRKERVIPVQGGQIDKKDEELEKGETWERKVFQGPYMYVCSHLPHR